MKMHEILSEEGYDKQRDADAVSGKSRKNYMGGGKKPKGYDKDKAEKAAVDNVKKVLAKENTAGSIAAVAMPMGKTISRQMKNTDGTAKNALDMDTNIMGQKKKSKRKKA